MRSLAATRRGYAARAWIALAGLLFFAASCGRIGYDSESEGTAPSDGGAIPINTGTTTPMTPTPGGSSTIPAPFSGTGCRSGGKVGGGYCGPVPSTGFGGGGRPAPYPSGGTNPYGR